MLDYDDINTMRIGEDEIMAFRTANPGDFYLEKKTLSSIDPFTQEKTYTKTLEMAEPVVRILKGDEHEIVSGMELNAGDIIFTLSWNYPIPRTEPSTTGNYYYDRIQYNDIYYTIFQVWEKGFGPNPGRKIVYTKKEKGTT